MQGVAKLKRWYDLIPRGTVTYGVRMCELSLWARLGRWINFGAPGTQRCDGDEW